MMNTGRPLISESVENFQAARVWLDQTARRLEHGPTRLAFQELIADLWQLRAVLPAARWQAFIAQARAHPLAQLIWQDPFLDHSRRRPRGYPGDAALLDWIYEAFSHEHAPDPSSIGGKVYGVSMNSMACCAVRWRRDHLAARLVKLGPSGRAMSLAAGHLREARMVLRMGHDLPRIDALDQDPRSLAEISATLPGELVRTHHVGVRELLKRTWEDGDDGYDLVYAAGLYDYLSDEVAAALNARLLERAAVGGTVLVANFLPGVPNVGHMECFMDWFLTFRTQEQLEGTFAALGDRVALRSFTDPFRNVVYTEATRLC